MMENFPNDVFSLINCDMVLHNDKWKHKAKRAVERKQRQKAEKRGGGENDQHDERYSRDLNTKQGDEKTDDKDGSNSSSSSSSSDETNDESFYEEKLESNEWRFTDPVVDETILKDPEYIQQLEDARIEEENRIKHMREIVVQNLKSHSEKYDDDIFQGSKKLKEIKDLKNGNLSNWKVGGDPMEDTVNELSGTPIIREFTEEEKLKFLELQQKIDHQKALEDMKSKIDRANRTGIKNQVLEVHGIAGMENYRGLVDRNLEKVGRNKVNIDQHDQLVEQMLGVNLHNDSDFEPAKSFDLETLIKRRSLDKNSSNVIIGGEKPSQLVELDDLDEDFLESLL